MKKRSMTGLAAAALMAALLPAAASASIVDGRPGQYEMDWIGINGRVDVGQQTGLCSSLYAEPVAGNSYIAGYDGEVHAVVNRNGARVTCKTTPDISGIYEANAEVGYTDNCVYWAEDGIWRGGTGRVTAAANNAEDGSDGGNVMFTCKFAPEDFTPAP